MQKVGIMILIPLINMLKDYIIINIVNVDVWVIFFILNCIQRCKCAAVGITVSCNGYDGIRTNDYIFECS